MANLKDLIVNGSARVLGAMYASDMRDSSRLTEFIVGTQTSATGSWTGVTKDDNLYDGKNINYFLPVAGSGNATLNLTLSTGSITGAKPVYLNNTSYVTTHFPANALINLTYNATKGAWFVNSYRDNDTTNRLKWDNNIKAAAACTNGKLICGTSAGYKDVAASVTFDISYPILWCNATIAANATTPSTYFAINGVNLQTTKASWTGTQWSTAYLVGTLSGKTFTIDSSVFTTTVPTTQDNKVYMPIGTLYSTYQIYFCSCKELYAYQNGSFGLYGGGGGDSLPSQTGNSGKLLTTDGTTASWGAVNSIYPVVATHGDPTTSSWYKIYAADSSGYQWCEQGGKYTFTTNGSKTIDLVLTMANTNYGIYTSMGYTSNSNIYTACVGITKTTSSFSAYHATANVVMYWMVAGYMELE